MDEAFMSQVAERIAAATEAVSSFSPTADQKNLAAAQTMDEWMTTHSPGTTIRCADCKAPLVEGSTKLCVACGNMLPSDLAIMREPFGFDKSLAKKHFYESLYLEDPVDISADGIQLDLQPIISGSKTSANGYSQQQLPSMPRLGAEIQERNLQAGESYATVSGASDSRLPPAHSLLEPLKQEEDEESIWVSSDTDNFGLQAWTQQLTRDSGGDPKDFASGDNSAALDLASQALGQTFSASHNDFFTTASISAKESPSHSLEMGFDVLFLSAPNFVDRSGVEQLAYTADTSFSMESPGPGIKTDFQDFFQVSHPMSGDQLLDPTVQMPDPFLRQASAGHTVGDSFDDFFQGTSKLTDRSQRHNKEMATFFSEEESTIHNIETEFDDFFHIIPKLADHSRGFTVDNPVRHRASGNKDESDSDDVFIADFGSGLTVETPIAHTTDESTDQDGEADFDDFLQAAPISAAQVGSCKEETSIFHLGKDLSSQSDKMLLDFFSQSSCESANQSPDFIVEASVAPHFSQLASVQNVSEDFYFFQGTPVSGDQSVVPLFPISVEQDSSQRLRTGFDLFQSLPESANHSSGLRVDTPVTPTAESSNGRDVEAGADFDDFFQAASFPASHSGGRNIYEARPNPAEPLGDEIFVTDFNAFFQTAPKSANAASGHYGRTGFDYLFEITNELEGRLSDKHSQHGVPDSVGRSSDHIGDPDVDEVLQGASIFINHSHSQKGKTVTAHSADSSVDGSGKTSFSEFFQASRHSVVDSNVHDGDTNFANMKDSAHLAKELSGQKVSMAFNGLFSSPSPSLDTGGGISGPNGLDDLYEVSPWSRVESLEQKGTTDFDDYVQAVPQSADKVINTSHTTEFGFLFRGTTGSVDSSQQSLTDFVDFFQGAPRTSETRSQNHFLKASNQVADWSCSKQGSTHLENLFDFPSRRTGAPNPSSFPSFLVHGNGSCQTKAGASSTSALTEGRSSKGGVLKELEEHISRSPSAGFLEPSRKMPNELSDLSFGLADRLVISEGSPTNLWSVN